MMEEKDRIKIIVGIVSGLVFVIGVGIGIQLYESTTQSEQKEQVNF